MYVHLFSSSIMTPALHMELRPIGTAPLTKIKLLQQQVKIWSYSTYSACTYDIYVHIICVLTVQGHIGCGYRARLRVYVTASLLSQRYRSRGVGVLVRISYQYTPAALCYISLINIPLFDGYIGIVGGIRVWCVWHPPSWWLLCERNIWVVRV